MIANHGSRYHNSFSFKKIKIPVFCISSWITGSFSLQRDSSGKCIVFERRRVQVKTTNVANIAFFDNHTSVPHLLCYSVSLRREHKFLMKRMLRVSNLRRSLLWIRGENR